MWRTRGWLTTALGVLAALGGCANPKGAGRACTPGPALPAVSRGSVEASITVTARDGSTAADPPAPGYRALTAAEAQCRAAAAAPGASLHTREADLAADGKLNLFKVGRADALRRDLFVYAALEIQNRSAGAALEAYYRLGEAEGKSELLDQAVAQLETTVRETRDMTAQKLTPPVALDVWTRQLLSTQGDRLKAQQAIEELNADLRRMLRLGDCGERSRFWNPEGYAVVDEPVDVDAAVCEALARRPELLVLRLLARDLSPATLQVVRDALRAAYPLLGAGGAKVAALSALVPATREEVEARRRQLADYLRERELAVAEEVRQAAAALQLQARLAAVARERERSWAEKVRDVRSRQQQGLTSFVEVTQTNLEWLKARADLVQEVMAWHVARAKFKQAQGLLVAECVCGGAGASR